MAAGSEIARRLADRIHKESSQKAAASVPSASGTTQGQASSTAVEAPAKKKRKRRGVRIELGKRAGPDIPTLTARDFVGS